MGHDCGSYGTILLADHQLAIPDDLVEHVAVHLDDSKVGAPVRILYLLRRLGCYTCTHCKSSIARSRFKVLDITNSYVQAWAVKLNAGDPNLRQLLVAVANVISYTWVLWVPRTFDAYN